MYRLLPQYRTFHILYHRYYEQHLKKHDVTNIKTFFANHSLQNLSNFPAEDITEVHGSYEYSYEQSIFHDKPRLKRRKGTVKSHKILIPGLRFLVLSRIIPLFYPGIRAFASNDTFRNGSEKKRDV